MSKFDALLESITADFNNPLSEYAPDDDWRDYIENEDLEEMDWSDLKEMSDHFGLNKTVEKLFTLKDGEVWFKLDGDYFKGVKDDWAEYLGTTESMKEHIDGMSDDEAEILVSEHIGGIENLYISAWGSTIKDMSESGGTVYHHTTEDAWVDIQESGVINGSYGTGINNRNAHGIFTTLEIEEYADGTYGDVMLELDLTKFVADNGKVDVSPEPEVLESEVKSFLAHILKLEDYYPQVLSDISGSTVVVSENLDLKYVTRIED